MASVYFDPAVGGDGSTVTDDSSATTGLGNGGHRTRFVPALSQIVAVAGNVTTKATQAASSATTATTKAGEASSSAASALSYLNDFKSRYLGAQAANPTTDLLGGALSAGDLYFNSTSNEMRVYTGSAWAVSYLPVGSYATLSGTETLTNKTFNLANNTLSGTLAQFNAACSDADFASLAGAETLTNKTVNLTNNTLSGTLAQFNAACSDADFQKALVSGTDIKTLNSSPILGSGDIAVQVPLVSGTNIKTVNGTSLLGNGDIAAGEKTLSLLSVITDVQGQNFPAFHMNGLDGLSAYSSGGNVYVKAWSFDENTYVRTAGAFTVVANNSWLSNTNYQHCSVFRLSATRGCVLYQNTTPAMCITTFSISGTTITPGTTTVGIAGSSTTQIGMMLDVNKLLVFRLGGSDAILNGITLSNYEYSAIYSSSITASQANGATSYVTSSTTVVSQIGGWKTITFTGSAAPTYATFGTGLTTAESIPSGDCIFSSGFKYIKISGSTMTSYFNNAGTVWQSVVPTAITGYTNQPTYADNFVCFLGHTGTGGGYYNAYTKVNWSGGSSYPLHVDGSFSVLSTPAEASPYGTSEAGGTYGRCYFGKRYDKASGEKLYFLSAANGVMNIYSLK